MKTSSPQSIRLKSPPSFLFRGPPGGGKSTFAMQFPGVWIGDVDLNLNGPEEFLRKQLPTLAYSFDTITLDDNDAPMTNADGHYLWPAVWLRCKTKVLEAIKNPDIKVLFLDGLTQLNNILVQKILTEQKASIMEIQHWIPFRNELMNLVMRCRHSGKVIIMSCHEEASVDRQGAITDWHISVSSRLKDVFGGLFTDIYAFECEVGTGGKKEFFLKSAPDGRRKDLKTSFPTMPAKINVTTNGFDTVNKYMKI